MDEQELALMLSDEEAPEPAGDVVLGIIQRLSPASDEYGSTLLSYSSVVAVLTRW